MKFDRKSINRQLQRTITLSKEDVKMDVNYFENAHYDGTLSTIHQLEIITGLTPEDYKDYCEEYQEEHSKGNPLFKVFLSYESFLQKHM